MTRILLSRHSLNRTIARYSTKKNAFSLLEVMAATAVFGMIAASTAGIFSSMQQAWLRQRNTVDLAQNARWATEFMTAEIRQAVAASVVIPPLAPPLTATILNFQNSAGTLIWYWRGDGAASGATSTIYRGMGNTFAIANSAPQEMAHFIVNNSDVVNNSTGLPPPDGAADPDPIFINNGGLLTIELTVRPQPAQPAGKDNRDYVLITRVRPRN